MKNKYFRYILLFLVSILLVSCKKDENIDVKGREYITESGFKTETTQETKIIETTTEVFDIKKHPELWSMTDKETYIFILNDVLDNGYGQKYIDKLPLSNRFRENRHNGIFDYIEQINRPEDWERYLSASASEEEFSQQLVWVCTGSWTIKRETLLKYTLDNENRLDSIKVIKSEITEDTVAESIANRPKSYDDLERYEKLIPHLVKFPVLVATEIEGGASYYTDDKEVISSNIEYYLKELEGCSDNFMSKFNPQKGIIQFDYPEFPYVIYDISENNQLTDLGNSIIGVNVLIHSYYSDCRVENKYIVNDILINTIDYYAIDSNSKIYEEYNRNFKVHFKVDDRNFLDSITKVEEVLEDGSVVEVENNFGK